jgi:hypothetical protein
MNIEDQKRYLHDLIESKVDIFRVDASGQLLLKTGLFQHQDGTIKTSKPIYQDDRVL